MTTFTIIFSSAVVLWICLTLWACLFSVVAAKELAAHLKRRQNRRGQRLAKWLKFHGGVK